MFAKDYIELEGWSDNACGYRGGAVPQSSAELRFVNTRVNFAQGTILLEMLRGEIRVCNVICAAGVHVTHFTTKHTEIATSWSMSEQALQGQLVQGSGLQSCWGEQKTDALQGVWHLSFTGASVSGDHSAALQPGWCKSDCAVLPWWVTTPGSHHLKWHLTKGPRQMMLCHPRTAQHQVPVTVLHWCWELEVFSFPSRQLRLSENQDSAGLAGVCDLA